MIEFRFVIENGGQALRMMALVPAGAVEGLKWKQSGEQIDSEVKNYTKLNKLAIHELAFWELKPLDLMGGPTLWEMPWSHFMAMGIYRVSPLDTAPAS